LSAPNVQCGNCESPLDEDRNEPHRQPCPGCGSTRRIFNLAVAETIHFRQMLGMKISNPSFAGKGHIRAEQLAGDELHRKTRKWFKKERVIDRENDRYFEKITDPETGQVIHHCDEPLTQHSGHGTARKQK